MRRRPHSSRALTTAGFLVLALASALAVPTAAEAHGDTVKVVITGQRDGHLTTDVTWENDGDAVDEAVAATVNATSVDGSRTAGPWRLVRDSGGGAGWSTAEILPPGTWKVSVDVGFPALGHGEREVAVPVVDPKPSPTDPAPSGEPSRTPSPAGPASAPTAAPTAAVAAASGDAGGWWWTTAGVAVTALAGTAVGLWLRRRRRR
ncbi:MULTISPECIES: LPXTG cell wall anchor domain-containing protein [unclassified Streptomyces]|uniref:LPXTG cell wall anchor domain-containing protein n=1 Tax=unclassified Streptomyces TaxID=2593676 RepID=UPI0014451D19|nr:LPXTG cell wall anchor domain-containing protein [Streptomyces sp. A1136]